MQKVQFYNNDRAPILQGRKKLKSFIVELFGYEKKELGSLTYIFCSDEYLLSINNEFLKHDFYTDVVTFDLSTNKKEIIGEVYISTDRVKDNAKQMNEGFNRELHRVFFHAALHLCGYKDKTVADIRKMRQKEEFYLKKYFS